MDMDPREAAWSVDTTAGSLVHKVLLRRQRHREWLSLGVAIRTYVGAALFTYGLMLLVALLGEDSLLHPSGSIRLPFLRDWNVAYMFVCSFPTLVLLTVSDDSALRTALNRVQRDQVVSVPPAQQVILQQTWTRRFRRINVVAQLAGVAVGTAVTIANYVAYSDVGYWAVQEDHLLPVGWLFLTGVWLFYSILLIYVIRTIYFSVFLADIVRNGKINMMPFHPDKAGGLRPVGTLGLRNQYGLTVLGLNIVTFALTTVLYLGRPTTLVVLVALACVAYVVTGPIVFVGPLLPFRGGMLRMKAELMSEVAERLRVELQRLRAHLRSGPISQQDEELIDRLRKIGAVIDELPVWPFDAGTLRRFVTAYLVPIAGALAYPIIAQLVEVWIRARP